MKAALLNKPADVSTSPLLVGRTLLPERTQHMALIKVSVCGICRTDLHVIEGELEAPSYPLIPGHQVVGTIQEIDSNPQGLQVGDRVGLAWLQATCGYCRFCQRGEENLCDKAKFTGWTVQGGYAEYVTAPLHYLYKLPSSFDDVSVSPLLCAGIIGYRSLKLMRMKVWQGARIGLYGFGNSAHIVIQFLKAWGAEVYVVTRETQHRELAEELGAKWVGDGEDMPPQKLDASVIFAPAGEIVPRALQALDRGGRLICAGIHMSPVPSIEYSLIYGERSIKTLTNNTRQDGIDFLEAAEKTPLTVHTQVFPLEQINEALQALKNDRIRGAGVIQI